jgi:hypothetical protein
MTSPAAARRSHRAAVAAGLLAGAPSAAGALDWAALAQAPAWLGLGDAGLALFARRVGSVLAAPALRLWIAAARVSAAQSALGADWWQALLARDDWPAMPQGVPAWPEGEAGAAQAVAGLLHDAGAAVLLATLPHGALRHAASQRLAPVAPFVMSAAAAKNLLATALDLQASLAPVGPAEASA